ncbi:retm [Symbiodinium sp. CCMP2456]|nr:retm [Symbiodinium sp. CCMP2456]
MAAATTWFDWLRCCSERETTQADDSGESLTALAREGEEAAEWPIVQKDIEHAEFHRLLQLRSRLRDCDDHLACRRQVLSRQPQTLLRFLRARNGDLQKAEVMFRKMLEWRHAFSVDEKVQQWKAELEEQSTQRSIQMRRFETDVELCRDRHGVPVRLVRTSVADVQGLVREFGKDLVLIDTIMRMERTHEEIRRAMLDTEKVVAGQLQIIDMGDYGDYGVPNLTSRLFSSLKLAAEISQITDANYPETVRKAFIIRLGSCTSTAWRYCIQPLLPERTQHKLVPCGPKASSWEAQLGAELDLTALPAFLCEDSDAAFQAAVPRGGLVPVGLAGKDRGTWRVEPAAMKKKPAGSRHNGPASKALRPFLFSSKSEMSGTACARIQLMFFGVVALAAGALAVEPVTIL